MSSHSHTNHIGIVGQLPGGMANASVKAAVDAFYSSVGSVRFYMRFYNVNACYG